MIVACLRRQTAIQAVFNRVRADLDVLNAVLGEDCDTTEIAPGPSLVFITLVSRTILPDEHEARRLLLAPYEAPAPLQPAQQAPAGGGNAATAKVISAELAKALTNREDRKDLERLKDGEVNNAGVMMAGDLDIESGEINLLAFPSPTHAYATALRKTTIRERQGALKRILDTGNRDVPENCTHATVRDMHSHDRVLVSLISTGCWWLKPMEALDEKVTEVRATASSRSTWSSLPGWSRRQRR